MSQQVQTTSRDAVLVEEAALLRMMGMPVLEAVPSAKVPYGLTDPFILVHEARFRLSEVAGKDKQAEPRALVLHRDQLPVRQEGDAIVRTLVGEGSPVQLGTPALILDVELPDGGLLTTQCRRSSRASPTCWTARPPSGRTGAGRDLPSWLCWVRAASSR
jgi:hypothetical protein